MANKVHKNPRRNIFVGPGQRITGGRKIMLDQFKAFNTEVADLDELVAMAAFGRSFRAEFESLNVSVPEFVDDAIRAIKREIETRVADRRAARVRELKAQRDSLKTAAEKREAIEKELASLGELTTA
jgi:hypothetical protein